MTPPLGRPFSAVVFDMDGLMLDTERIARRAWDLALGERGLAITPEVYLRVVGRPMPAVREVFLEALGAGLPIDAVIERKRGLMEKIFMREGVPVKPGLEALLAGLRRRSVPVAVASSTFRKDVLHRLFLAGLGDRFGVVVGGDEAARGKPAPDLFLEACRRLALPPADCVVLEDSEAGVRAAHAAGAMPVMVPDMVPPSPEVRALARGVFSSLTDVTGFLGL